MKTRINIAYWCRKAHEAKLVYCPFYDNEVSRNFIRRAQRAFKRNLAEPGDCRGDTALLAGLAVAFAQVGLGAGWIPETQRIGVKVAELITL